MSTARRLAHLGLLLLMGCMWGLQFAMLKLAAGSGYGSLGILLLTLFALSLIFGVMLLLRGGVFRLSVSRLRFLVVTALLGYVLPLAAALYAARHIAAGVLTLIATLTPVVTVGIALALRTERVSPQRLAAVVLGSLAVALVLWPELELPGGGDAAWLLVALALPLCYGAESVYVAARWPRGLDTLQLVSGEAIVATLLVVPLFALAGEPQGFEPGWGFAEGAVAVFVVAGVVETFAYFHLISHTGGVLVSFGSFVSLFAGIAWGMVLFGETHGALTWAAVAALLAALALLALDRPATPAATPAHPSRDTL